MSFPQLNVNNSIDALAYRLSMLEKQVEFLIKQNLVIKKENEDLKQYLSECMNKYISNNQEITNIREVMSKFINESANLTDVISDIQAEFDELNDITKSHSKKFKDVEYDLNQMLQIIEDLYKEQEKKVKIELEVSKSQMQNALNNNNNNSIPFDQIKQNNHNTANFLEVKKQEFQRLLRNLSPRSPSPSSSKLIHVASYVNDSITNKIQNRIEAPPDNSKYSNLTSESRNSQFLVKDPILSQPITPVEGNKPPYGLYGLNESNLYQYQNNSGISNYNTYQLQGTGYQDYGASIDIKSNTFYDGSKSTLEKNTGYLTNMTNFVDKPDLGLNYTPISNVSLSGYTPNVQNKLP